MIVDDVVVVSPGFLADTELREFDDTYRSVLTSLNLTIKPDDDSAYKAFSSRSQGEVELYFNFY